MLISRNTLKDVTGCDYYDGSVLHDRFAYDFFRKKTLPIGNIVVFRAPMEVLDNLIDLEDKVNNDFISSADAINIIWEIPILTDSFGAVAFQRLFNTYIASQIASLTQKNVEVDGDDIMVNDTFIGSDNKEYKQGKCSVSITAVKNGAAIGHTAINIDAGQKAPGFAYSTHMTDEQINVFVENVIKLFYNTCDDIFNATTKIRI